MSGEFNNGALAWVIVLPICFVVGVAIMTWTVVRRWKRDDAAPVDRQFYYESTPGMTLEERVRKIHEARELEQLRRTNGGGVVSGQAGMAPPPPAYVPPPTYTS